MQKWVDMIRRMTQDLFRQDAYLTECEATCRWLRRRCLVQSRLQWRRGLAGIRADVPRGGRRTDHRTRSRPRGADGGGELTEKQAAASPTL